MIKPTRPRYSEDIYKPEIRMYRAGYEDAAIIGALFGLVCGVAILGATIAAVILWGNA